MPMRARWAARMAQFCRCERNPMTNRTKRLVVTSVASGVALAFAGACMINIGADGPGALGWVGLVLLFPACMVGGTLSAGSFIVIPVLGFLQFFAIFWIILKRRYGTPAS